MASKHEKEASMLTLIAKGVRVLTSTLKAFSQAAREAALEARRAKGRGKKDVPGQGKLPGFDDDKGGKKPPSGGEGKMFSGSDSNDWSKDDLGEVTDPKSGLGITDYAGDGDPASGVISAMSSGWSDAMSGATGVPEAKSPERAEYAQKLMEEAGIRGTDEETGYSDGNFHLISRYAESGEPKDWGINSHTGKIYDSQNNKTIGRLTGDHESDVQTLKDLDAKYQPK